LQQTAVALPLAAVLNHRAGYDAIGAQVLGIADCNMACPGNTSQSCGGAWGMQVYRFNDPPAADASHAGTVPIDSDNAAAGVPGTEQPADGVADQQGGSTGGGNDSGVSPNSQGISSMQELLQPSTNLLVGPAASAQLMAKGSVEQQQVAKEYSGACGAAASAVMLTAAGLLAVAWSL
jgi:hypothetical protein